MAKLTMVFGVLLIALGVVAHAKLHHIHTLIPAVFGLLLFVFGLLANTDDAKKRMIFMHVAVTVGLLGFLGTIPGMIGVIQLAMGHAISRPADAARVQAIMGALCFLFTALCVRSFIAARRARLAS